MPRAPDPRVEQARKLFLSGKKLIEISQLLGVPEGTIRSWKNRYQWESNSNATLQKPPRETQRCKQKKTQKNKNGKLLEDSIPEDTGLTEKQQLFCTLYAKTLNATQAYKKAYGCSYEAALTAGTRLLKNVRIKAEVERLKRERFETQLFDEHDIFQWHLDIATASITDYVSFGREMVPVISMAGPVTEKDPETGEKIPVMKEVNFVKFQESAEVDGRLIRKVKMGKDGASIELYDAMKAMEWLTEHMSLGTTAQQGLASSIISAWRREDDPLKAEDKAGSTNGGDG